MTSRGSGLFFYCKEEAHGTPGKKGVKKRGFGPKGGRGAKNVKRLFRPQITKKKKNREKLSERAQNASQGRYRGGGLLMGKTLTLTERSAQNAKAERQPPEKGWLFLKRVGGDITALLSKKKRGDEKGKKEIKKSQYGNSRR